MMADRDAIIEKIKALFAKTTENGCTEGEMLSALDKAAALQDAYDITDEELQIAKDEAVSMHADPPNLKDPHQIKWRLSYGVAQFCDVRIFRTRHTTDPQRATAVRCTTQCLKLCNRRFNKISSSLSSKHLRGF